MMRSLLPLLLFSLAVGACDGDSPAALDEASVSMDRDGSAALSSVGDASGRLCPPTQVRAVLEFGVGAAEGVAVSRQGDVFVGNIITGEIWRAPHGDFSRASVLADLLQGSPSFTTFLLGMDVSKEGILYAAVNALFDPSVHGLWRVAPDGTASRAGVAPAFFGSVLNDVAIDTRSNVYVSESLGGAIWRLTPDGEFGAWITSDLLLGGVHPGFGVEFGANGLAYHKGALYAGIHLNGRVIRVPIERDGSPGAPAIVIEDAALIGNDGLELDPRGNIYVANNFSNTVQRIRASDLGIETVVGEGLSAPASIAFSSNHRMLYVANLSTSAVFPQPHAPALVRAEFAAPVVSGRRACSSLY
jgi:sugar lactone lactonase YvrE